VGWRLVTVTQPRIDDDLTAWFTAIRGVIVPIGGDGGVADADGAYGTWFAERGVVAALQRPDFVLFGTAAGAEEIPGLLRALRATLGSV
jgi:3-(3-hydroxy-phenyl)propionate hydroxylase